MPFFLRTSATIGTVELTGFEMTRTKALGECSAMPTAMSRTIPALICASGNHCRRARCDPIGCKGIARIFVGCPAEGGPCVGSVSLSKEEKGVRVGPLRSPKLEKGGERRAAKFALFPSLCCSACRKKERARTNSLGIRSTLPPSC